MLTDEQITKFQELHKKHFGEEISRDEARRSGLSLINLMRRTYKPMSKEDLKALNKTI